MPTYEYRCLSCNHQFERFQRMSDEPVKVCEACGEPVKRLLFPVAIHFKGSGFYTTDYASGKGKSCVGNNTDNGSSPSESGANSASSESASATTESSTSSKDSSGNTPVTKTADKEKPAVTTSEKKN